MECAQCVRLDAVGNFGGVGERLARLLQMGGSFFHGAENRQDTGNLSNV